MRLLFQFSTGGFLSSKPLTVVGLAIFLLKNHLVRIKNTMSITQKDLAKRAGVSVVTVFNALYKPSKVKAETRARIFRLMEEFDYSPDGVARSMVLGKTKLVGVLVPTFEILYYARLVSVIERELNVLGYRALISQHLDDPEKEALELKLMREYRVDGIILRNCGIASDQQQIVRLSKASIPFVLVDGLSEGFEDRYVGDDDGAGVEQLIDMIVASGRRRIACIGFHRSGDMRNSNRYRGYCASLRRHGIPLDDGLVMTCLTEYSSGDFAIAKLLNQNQSSPPDAVFAFNDDTAMGVIRQLLKLGYKPQEDILVSGYGGYIDETVLPFRFPSVRQDIESIGKFSVAKLMQEITGGDDSFLGHRILVRGRLRV